MLIIRNPVISFKNCFAFCNCVQSLTIVQVWQDANARAGVFRAKAAT